MTVSRLIRKLLDLRKKQGSRKKILIVLDEAQEYIPGETREKDGTFELEHRSRGAATTGEEI